jgi:ribosomal protein S18 acetylase RimI-like enzyme
MEIEIDVTRMPPSKSREISKLSFSVPPLEGHEPHFYKIVADYFGDTAFVAYRDGEIVGFAFGIVSQVETDLFFLWQLGVREDVRSSGVGRRLVTSVLKAAAMKGCRRAVATVLKENTTGMKFFESMGFKHVSAKFDESKEDASGLFYVPNFYYEGENILVYEKEIC